MATTDTDASSVKSTRVYLAMMLLAFFAGTTGLARVYRGDRSLGWGRFWTFIGCIVLGMISAALPALAILVGLVEMGLGVWAIVDFFLLYGTKTDATGKELQVTPYDKKFAKVLFIVFIVLLSLSVVGALISLIFWSAVISGVMSGSLRTNNSTYTAPSYNNSRSVELFSASEAASIQEGMTKAHVESILHGATGSCTGDTSYEFCYYDSSSNLNSNSVSVTYENGTVYSANAY